MENLKTEIYGHNTKAIKSLKKLEKFTNWLKNNVVCPEITNNILSFVLGRKITIFNSPSPNTFFKKLLKEKKFTL